MGRRREWAEPRFYSVEETAELLRMSKKWVRGKVHNGELEAFGLARRFRISGTSINVWVDRNLVVKR
jgi:excisionase family DNA binding protein|tara:strand:- start:92 stop:292 length:201 start_codon:yes stop_codon:yes gene_type:complete